MPARGIASLPADFTAIPVEVAFRAPSLTLRDLNEPQRSLRDYVGQVVLVNLWAPWSPMVLMAIYNAVTSRTLTGQERAS